MCLANHSSADRSRDEPSNDVRVGQQVPDRTVPDELSWRTLGFRATNFSRK